MRARTALYELSHQPHNTMKTMLITVERTMITPRNRTRQMVAPGAKLLCVDDANLHRPYSPGPVIRGRIYCVREHYEEGGIPGVLLVGIHGPFIRGGLECGFRLMRFVFLHD